MRTAKMVWDGKATSWRFYGVVGQPAAVLVGTDGRIVARWTGLLDTGKVRTALKRATPPAWPPKA